MDLTNLALAVALALGLISADAVWNAHNLSIEINIAQAPRNAGWEEEFVEQLFITEVQKLTSFPSVVSAPVLRSKNEKTPITVLAEALHLGELTFAAQEMFGIKPVRLVGSLIASDQDMKLVITGHNRHSGSFDIVVTDHGDVQHLVRRAAFEMVAAIDPYLAAVNLFESGIRNKDLSPAKALIQRGKSRLPPKPVNEQRSIFENLEGIIALLENDVPGARIAFQAAVASWPQNPIALLNLAFVEVEQDQYTAAIRAARRVIETDVDTTPAVISTAYVTIGVCNWALGDRYAAEKMFAKAVDVYPGSSTAYEHWAALLGAMDRPIEAEAKARRGQQNLAKFENYVEVAALYFRMTETRTPLTPRDVTP